MAVLSIVVFIMQHEHYAYIYTHQLHMQSTRSDNGTKMVEINEEEMESRNYEEVMKDIAETPFSMNQNVAYSVVMHTSATL